MLQRPSLITLWIQLLMIEESNTNSLVDYMKKLIAIKRSFICIELKNNEIIMYTYQCFYFSRYLYIVRHYQWSFFTCSHTYYDFERSLRHSITCLYTSRHPVRNTFSLTLKLSSFPALYQGYPCKSELIIINFDGKFNLKSIINVII